MSVTCPQGHESTTSDFCDVCGEPIGAAAVSAPAAPSSATPSSSGPESALTLDPPATAPLQQCPNCGGTNPGDALFCEECGYDFTTGQLPGPIVPMPDPGADWVAEVWIDSDWFAFQDSPGGCATSGAPTVVPIRGATALIGRPSKSRNLMPEIDCTTDGAVSHRHAQLKLDHDRWYVEDLGSTNGTFVGAPDQSLPTAPLEPQKRHELADDERVYVGAWTRIVVRRATDDEKTGVTS
jgi:FHA domain